MNWRKNGAVLLLATIVLFAIGYAMKVPQISAADLIVTTVAGLIVIDVRARL